MYTVEVYSYKDVEHVLKGMIPIQFKDGENARTEMIHMHYVQLQRLVDMAVGMHNAQIEAVNDNLEDMYNAVLNEPPAELQPLQLRKLSMRITSGGEEVMTATINLDDLPPAEQQAIIRQQFAAFRRDRSGHDTRRAEFEAFMAGQNYSFRRKPLWTKTKPLFDGSFSMKY